MLGNFWNLEREIFRKNFTKADLEKDSAAI